MQLHVNDPCLQLLSKSFHSWNNISCARREQDDIFSLIISNRDMDVRLNSGVF